VRLAHENTIYVVEANPNPLPRRRRGSGLAAAEAGYPYPDLLEKIAEMAIVRRMRRSGA